MLQGLAPKKRVAGPAQTLYPLISQNRTVTIPLPHPSQGWTLGPFVPLTRDIKGNGAGAAREDY